MKPQLMFKRRNVWTFKTTISGITKQVSLGTTDEQLARARRDALLERLKSEELAELRGPKARQATVAEVLERYPRILDSGRVIEAGVVRHNVAACRNLLRWGEREAETCRVSELTEELVRRAQGRYLAVAGADREQMEQRRRGLRSLFRLACSVFSRAALPLYRDLHLPDVGPFVRACHMETTDRVHRPIDLPTLAAMDAAAATLRTERPELWLVHVLAKFAGLRNGEICEVRVNWFTRAPWGQVFLSLITRPDFAPKGSEGHVPLHSGVAALLAPFAQGRAEDAYLLECATPTGRQSLVDREHARFVRRFLPAERYAKAGYELRRWSAQTMEARYGRDAAEAFLRHAPKTVAERHYFERWYPWRRCGEDVGVTIEDARGAGADVLPAVWVEGAAALRGRSATCQVATAGEQAGGGACGAPG